MLRVQPVTDKRLAGGSFALRNFVFVMRKSQVDSAGVDVDGFSQKLHGHCGTFDVPARASRTDRGFPEMLAGLRRFPQRKIARTLFFVAIVVHARACLDSTEVNLR